MKQLRKIIGKSRIECLQHYAKQDGCTYEFLLRELVESYLSRRYGDAQDKRWKDSLPPEYQTPEARRFLGLDSVAQPAM
jgi:hypothetical protein